MIGLSRRGLLVGLLAAPAVVRAASLMPVHFRPIFWGDGEHDDSPYVQWLVDRAARHVDPGRRIVSDLSGAHLMSPVRLPDDFEFSRNHVVVHDGGYLVPSGGGLTVIRHNWFGTATIVPGFFIQWPGNVAASGLVFPGAYQRGRHA